MMMTNGMGMRMVMLMTMVVTMVIPMLVDTGAHQFPVLEFWGSLTHFSGASDLHIFGWVTNSG